MADINNTSKEILCKVLNCGYGDLPTLFNTKIDVATYIRNGITSFNDILRYGFYDEVERLGLYNYDFGEEGDFRIEANYMCSDIYIKNRSKYDKDLLLKLEQFMDMDLIDIED